MNILTVDDDDIALEMLNMALQQAGYETTSACNGHEALAILRKGEHRLVITDWEMPGMDGLALCNAIRQEELPNYVYTIMLTSHRGVDQVVEGMNAGADDFIVKPFSPQELTVRVRAGERILSMETREVAIFAMAKLAESRDPETGSHLERVQEYCRALARHLATNKRPGYEVDSQYVRTIYLTSPLHDIGKIGIPDSVLLKPGRLSDREFEIMKTHTRVGADTLDAAVQQFPDAKFLLMARDVSLTHHERFDGTGYPQGLTGANIPLSGRIVAVADVYDALTTKRVYKHAFAHDLAKAIILEETGSHFDPEVVSAFLAMEGEFTRIRERYAEVAKAA
ncbi:MAG: response regulator [Phycisphaerae bacterium]|nr:response regulator [Phycisphaerae bacterium]